MTELMTNQFLEQIVPQGQTLCLARERSFPDPSRPKLSWRHQFISAKAVEMRRKAIAAALSERDTNVYFAVAGYDSSKRRKAENVTGIKCLLLDIDIGKGDAFFATKQAALPALQKLHQAAPLLPKPWLIDSGNGIHVYYPLKETLTTIQWGPLASLFADVVRAVEPKLMADPVRTRDAASVMRLPGSWNAKQVERKPVKVLRSGEPAEVEQVKATLAQAAAAHNVSGIDDVIGDTLMMDMPSLPSYMDIETSVEFGGGLEAKDREEFSDLNLRPIIEGCKQMREICEVKGDVPEPQWVNFLRVINTVKDADDVACFFSSGHPTYSMAGTKRKLRHIRMNFDSATAGCKEFKEANPSGCHGCPHKKKVWTPSQLGVLHAQTEEIKAAEVEATESAVSGESTPQGYIPQPAYVKQHRTQGHHHEVTYLPVRQAGKDAKFVHEPVVAGHLNLINSTAMLESIVVNHREVSSLTEVNVHIDIATQGYSNHAVCSTVDLTSTGFDKATEALRRRGVVFESTNLNQRTAVSKYLQEIVKLSSNKRGLFRPVKGWRKSGNLGEWSFVAGARHFQPDGKQTDNVTSAEHRGLDARHEGFMERACTGIPVGQLDRWQRGMAVYNGKGLEVAQLLLLSGLSNMLLPLLSGDKGGILLALTGESGAGKTTLLRCMASFMGDYTRYVVPGSSTSNAIGMLMQQANCMMMPVDDTLSKDGEVFSSLLTMVTGGAEKMRMTWDSKTGGSVPYEEGFNTSLLLTSNYSTTATIGTAGRGKDQLQTEAARTRTLEFPSEDIVAHHVSKDEWLLSQRLVKSNHGHAAYAFLRYVVDNQVTVTNALRKMEQEISARLRQQVERTKAGQVRFWAKFLAVTGVTARIICHNLNLLPWNHTNILAAGELLVSETVRYNKMSDTELVDSFWAVCCEEPTPHHPVINFVTREALRKDWQDWRFATRQQRMQHSHYVNSVGTGDGMQLPAAASTNRWRVDTTDIKDSQANVLWRERTVFIPLSEIKTLVGRLGGDRLPVSDWSDLYTRLRSAGCLVYGVVERQPDKLSHPAVRVNVGISKHSPRGFARGVVEIRLPPEQVA